MHEYVHNFAGHLSIYENRYLFCKADKERYIANNEVELQMRKVKMQMIKGVRRIMTRNADEVTHKVNNE
jgi:hypothetical protein